MTLPGPSITPEVAALLERAVRKRYAPKSLIVSEGEKSDALYYVVTGSVTVSVEASQGGELILAYIGPGEFFGELSSLGAGPTRSASVRARGESEIAVIPHRHFQESIERFPALLLQLTGQVALRLRAASRKLGDLAFVDVAGRIAHALLELAADSQAVTHPDGMLVRITREELGRLVNCSRQTASEVLSDLERQGLIEVQGRSIVIRGASRTRTVRQPTERKNNPR